jgi:hypothetical protein
MKKCPPGVICIENVSMFFIMACIIIVGYVFYTSFFRQNVIVNNNPSEKIVIKDTKRENPSLGWFGIPSWPYTNVPNDPLLNPYVPPLRDERYFIPSGGVPINVSTNIGAVDTNYRQVGLLTATNSKGKLIPLMGRPLFTNRDKWQYYSMSDQNNSIKLPISRNGKSCTNEYGCDKLYNGDTVYIEGLNEPYKVTVYDNDTIRYLPFI